MGRRGDGKMGRRSDCPSVPLSPCPAVPPSLHCRHRQSRKRHVLQFAVGDDQQLFRATNAKLCGNGRENHPAQFGGGGGKFGIGFFDARRTLFGRLELGGLIPRRQQIVNALRCLFDHFTLRQFVAVETAG